MKLTKGLIEQYLKIKKMQQKLMKKQAQIKEMLMQKKKSKFAVDKYEITIKAFRTFVEAHTREGHIIKVKKLEDL